MPRAVVFDVDGTLTATNAVDDECYRRAIAEALEISAEGVDWSDAPHMTDEGLLQWIAERHGRVPDDALRARAMQRFFALLDEAAREAPHRFCEIPGAAAAMDAARDAGWHVTIATGCWEPSARRKLTLAGLDHAAVPLATSSDAVGRVDIMRLALERAGISADGCDRIVAVGDAAWDVRAAAELGWPLVAIAHGESADRLRRHGAGTILPDFRDLAAFLAALDHARVPDFAP